MSRLDDLRRQREAKFAAKAAKAAKPVTLPKATPVTLQPHPDCPVCRARAREDPRARPPSSRQ
jgi:hypothetical protein